MSFIKYLKQSRENKSDVLIKAHTHTIDAPRNDNFTLGRRGALGNYFLRPLEQILSTFSKETITSSVI